MIIFVTCIICLQCTPTHAHKDLLPLLSVRSSFLYTTDICTASHMSQLFLLTACSRKNCVLSMNGVFHL